jgi:hypothetical protein
MATPDAKIPTLLTDVADNLSSIVSNEIRLGRAEMKRGVADLGRGVSLMMAALMFAVPAVTLLAFAGVAAMTQAGVQSWLASLSVAIGLGVLAIVLFAMGRKGMASDHIRLETTTQNIKQDLNSLKESAR